MYVTADDKSWRVLGRILTSWPLVTQKKKKETEDKKEYSRQYRDFGCFIQPTTVSITE